MGGMVDSASASVDVTYYMGRGKHIIVLVASFIHIRLQTTVFPFSINTSPSTTNFRLAERKLLLPCKRKG